MYKIVNKIRSDLYCKMRYKPCFSASKTTFHFGVSRVFVKPVQYNIFGDIIFYMTPEEELSPEFKNVQVSVVVE